MGGTEIPAEAIDAAADPTFDELLDALGDVRFRFRCACCARETTMTSPDPYTDSDDVVLVARVLCPDKPHLARKDARAVLAALAEKGRLQPAGEARTEWGVRYGDWMAGERYTEAGARRMAAETEGEPVWRAVGPWQPAPADTPDPR